MLALALRGALSHSSMDQGSFPDSIRQSTEEVLETEDRLFEEFHGKGNLKIFYSLRALMNCSQELIEKTAARAVERDTFFQAHMNEYAGKSIILWKNIKCGQWNIWILFKSLMIILLQLTESCFLHRNADFLRNWWKSGTLSIQQLWKRCTGYSGSAGKRGMCGPWNRWHSTWWFKSLE